MAMLFDEGFQRVELSRLNFLQQVELFASAKELVIPHGAASANLFATNSGARVIEIMPSFGWSRSTVRICKARSLDYNVVEARARWGNMLVNVDELYRQQFFHKPKGQINERPIIQVLG